MEYINNIEKDHKHKYFHKNHNTIWNTLDTTEKDAIINCILCNDTLNKKLIQLKERRLSNSSNSSNEDCNSDITSDFFYPQ